MKFSTTTLTLFLTALASPLSTTQARIGQTHSTDNRMMLEDICSSITVEYNCLMSSEDDGAGGYVNCDWTYSSLLERDACHPKNEEQCNLTCGDYCDNEVHPQSAAAALTCFHGCMYPLGLNLPTPCHGNINKNNDRKLETNRMMEKETAPPQSGCSSITVEYNCLMSSEDDGAGGYVNCDWTYSSLLERDACHPKNEEQCNLTCGDYCDNEVHPQSAAAALTCFHGCMYPLGLNLPTPCHGNINKNNDRKLETNRMMEEETLSHPGRSLSDCPTLPPHNSEDCGDFEPGQFCSYSGTSQGDVTCVCKKGFFGQFWTYTVN